MTNSQDSIRPGWHSRDYLPHFDSSTCIQALTFRLADALPQAVAMDLALQVESPRKRARLDALLDAGSGACLLRDETIAKVVEDALLHFDGKRYTLIAWCVMPTHVHALIQQADGFPLGQIVHSWKSFSAKLINARMARSGQIWHPDYYDRFIRNDQHLQAAVAYIEENPVKAGLIANATQWRWSSAWRLD